MKHRDNVYVYELNDNLYINLTNKCTSNCEFCVRNQKDGIGTDVLWLRKEPDTADIMEQFNNFDVSKYKQIVFCGYGEPTLRLDTLIETAREIKQKYGLPIRINTNGHANLYYKKDITPRFEGIIDKVSISLNHSDAAAYDNICHSIYGLDAFQGMLDFAEKCKLHVPSVTLTIVDILPEEVQNECRVIADTIGVELKIRPLIS
ncbi:MAG: radical SAM protein [Clostridia bacterium]|nr:radical SAM protein [Clostridia bacterium]